MTFLPIVERELRIAARRRSTFHLRLGAAIVATLGSAWIFLGMADRMTPSQLGQSLFGFLTVASFLFCLFSGVRVTADCISSEKREGTLGLLFLTDLRGHDVVLGKLASTSLTVTFALLASLPILSLPLLLGGVSAGQFWRVVLAMLCTHFLSISTGILVSTFGWNRQSTAFLGTSLLVFLNLVPPLLTLLHLTGNTFLNGHWSLLASPSVTTFAAFDFTHAGWKGHYWTSVAVQLGAGFIALLVAMRAIPHQWQDRPASARAQSWRDRWKTWKLGNSGQRAQFRQELLDVNPFYWLASRDRLGPAKVRGFLGVIACAWIGGAMVVGDDWFHPATYFSTGILLCLSLKVWIGSEASRRFAEDKATGALELLFSTPITAREIIHGHFLSMRRQFQGPVFFTLGACLAMCIAGSWRLDDWPATTLLIIGYLAMFLFDAVALAWTGFWQGLVAKKINRAGTQTLFLVLVLPVLLYLGGFLGVGLLSAFLDVARNEMRETYGQYGYFIISAGVNLTLIRTSRSRLLHHLRAIASDPFSRTTSNPDTIAIPPAESSSGVPPRLA